MPPKLDIKTAGEDLRRWYLDYYKRIIKCPDDVKFHSEFSNAGRLVGLKYLKGFIRLDHLDNIVTTFVVSDPTTDDKVIYGMLYTIKKEEEDTTSSTKNLHHSCVCLGQSLISRDGEYRQKMILITAVQYIMSRFDGLMRDLESYVLKFLKSTGLVLHNEFFYSETLEQYSQEMESSIVSAKYDMYFFMFSFFSELMNYYYENRISNINPIFEKIYRLTDKAIFTRHMEFMGELDKRYGKDFYLCYNNISCYILPGRIGTHGSFKMGQKLIPLNYAEVENPFCILYKPWREFLIGEAVQSMVVNGICTGVPFISDYFYVKNAKKTLFDNEVQYMKLEHSEQAEKIVRELQIAQRSTFKTQIKHNVTNHFEHVEPEKTKGGGGGKHKSKHTMFTSSDLNPDNLSAIEEWLSGKFKTLHRKIQDPVDYAKEEIIMSDITFGYVSEYVGRTIYTSFELFKHNDVFHQLFMSPMTNYPVFAKYMFEICYTLYCLNHRYGVIHGDLHLNNATIGPSFFHKHRTINVTNPMAGFDVSGIKFAFSSNQYSGKVIDFSRSIIRPSKINLFNDVNIKYAKGKSFPYSTYIQLLSPEQEDEFIKDQCLRIWGLYTDLFPDTDIDKHAMLSVLYKNLDQIFPLITTIDFYTFFSKLSMYFKGNKGNKSFEQQIKLVEHIKDTAVLILIGKLKAVISDPKLLQTQEYQEYGSYRIIMECFTDFIVKDFSGLNLIDYSCSENPMDLNLDDYENFPEVLKHSICLKEDGKTYPWPIKPKFNEFVWIKEYQTTRFNSLKKIAEMSYKLKNKVF